MEKHFKTRLRSTLLFVTLMTDNLKYKKWVIILIVSIIILKIIVSTTIDLGNDESYYWLFSQQIKWNYFDHPPMVAIWIRIFTANLLLEQYEVFVRLGAIIGSGLSSWFLYKCVTRLSNPQAGWYAACLYSASFYAAITSGLFIFPDSPQMVFYTFSLWMIAEITYKDDSWTAWLLLGIASGLCIMSKVHGIFIWVGLGLYILIFKRSWLANPRMYVSVVIAAVIVLPILFWNLHYDFLTYKFNSGRIVIKGHAMDLESFYNELKGQLFINNPFIVVFTLVALLGWLRYQRKFPSALTIYNFIALPIISLLLLVSLYRATLPHWSGPAYVALIPFAAIHLFRVSKTTFFPKLIVLALGSCLLFLITCPVFVNYYPGHLGKTGKGELGKGDISLDMLGWKDAGKVFDTLYKHETASGIMPENAAVVCNKWWGAHVEYYFCRPNKIPMLGLGEINELHEYMWLNTIRKERANLDSVYCIVNSDDHYDVRKHYVDYYNRIDTIQVINISRGGRPAHDFVVFRLTGFKNNLPVME